MAAILMLVLICWNLFVSYSNAKAAGQMWQDSKAIGGWTRVLAWSVAIQSAMGFTMIYAIVVGVIGMMTGFLSASVGALFMNLIYVIIAVPLVGTGLLITIESWIRVVRERSLLNIGVAAYNTLASAYNVYSTVNSLPKAWDSVMKGFDSDKDFDLDSDLSKAVAIAAVALLGGILTTVLVMRRSMGTLPLPERELGEQKL